MTDLSTLRSPLSALRRRLLRAWTRDLCEKSPARLIYRSRLGVDLQVHPQKLVDILERDESCDAEPVLLALQERLPEPGICLDVGANIGVVSCWLGRRARQVFSFEPDAANFRHLQANIELNGLENVEALQLAVAAREGTADFYERRSFGHHSLSPKHLSPRAQVIRVPVTSLDRFCSARGIDRVSLLKIDVEGTEDQVLEGFSDYLASRRVDCVLFEHAPVLLSAAELTGVATCLAGHGYAIFDMGHCGWPAESFTSAPHGDYYAVPA